MNENTRFAHKRLRTTAMSLLVLSGVLIGMHAQTEKAFADNVTQAQVADEIVQHRSSDGNPAPKPDYASKDDRRTSSQREQIDQKKLVVAEHLTDWMQETLQSNKTLVAIVCRKGGKDLKSRDFTGMAHSGIAVYDPRAQTWILYQIINKPKDGVPSAVLWKTAPLDFFYGQTGYEENALVLIPDAVTQQRMYNSVLSGTAFKLAFTKKYNLLSRYDSSDSLNCNKWILMNVAAARSDDYDPDHVLRTIREGFNPANLRLGFIARSVAKHKANVVAAEVPDTGPVQTVTPESLYESGLFPVKIFTVPTKVPEHT